VTSACDPNREPGEIRMEIRMEIERTQTALSTDVDTRHPVGGSGSGPMSATADAASRSVETVQEMPRTVRRQAQGNPLPRASSPSASAGWSRR
jgi:hypothetical protein